MLQAQAGGYLEGAGPAQDESRLNFGHRGRRQPAYDLNVRHDAALGPDQAEELQPLLRAAQEDQRQEGPGACLVGF